MHVLRAIPDVLFMASPPGNDPHSFHEFFDGWLAEQARQLQELISASQATGDQTDSSTLGSLITRVVRHHEHYYRAKSVSAKKDILSMLNPAWRSSLEEAFLWIGGWRPSMAFHLLFSKSGLQFESGFEDLMRGFSTGDLGDLSPAQLKRVDSLQRETIRKEKQLSEELASQQETVADASMVQLSHAVGEMTRSGGAGSGSPAADSVQRRVEDNLVSKEEGLEELLQKADDLRLQTLKDVIEILTPIQAVHFLVAAAELHLRFHEWGLKRDADGPHHNR